MKNIKLEEFNKSLKDKNVAILGLGVSNLPLIDYLYKYEANICLFDDKEYEKLDSNVVEKIEKYNLKYYLGENSLSNLSGFENMLFNNVCTSVSFLIQIPTPFSSKNSAFSSS